MEAPKEHVRAEHMERDSENTKGESFNEIDRIQSIDIENYHGLTAKTCLVYFVSGRHPSSQSSLTFAVTLSFGVWTNDPARQCWCCKHSCISKNDPS